MKPFDFRNSILLISPQKNFYDHTTHRSIFRDMVRYPPYDAQFWLQSHFRNPPNKMASNHKFQSPRYAYQNPFTGIDRSKHSNSFYRVIFGRLTRETIPRSFSNEQTSSFSVGKRCSFCGGKILLRTTRKFQTSAEIWGIRSSQEES